MIQIRRADDRGKANYGWLDARYTFSFGDYFDPIHVRFGPLRVLNQDRVAPGRGFPRHGHDNMEIVTYVLQGVLEHKDSMGNGSQMKPGDVQFMSAGSGVQHSEYNASKDEELRLMQMWIVPAERNTEPQYEQRTYTDEDRHGALRLCVSPNGDGGSLTIGQDARMYTGLFSVGERATHTLADKAGYLHVAEGAITLNGNALHAGDGAAITGESHIEVVSVESANIVLWEFPAGLVEAV